MRRYQFLFVFLCFIAVGSVASAKSGRLIKVLPEFLDKRGMNSISPSLFERDAYQDTMRKDPSKRSALAFYVQWKAKDVDAKKLKMRIEMRGVHGNTIQNHTIEQGNLKRKWFSTWSIIKFDGQPYKEFGELIAWRVTLWEEDTLLAEQKSFMWQYGTGDQAKKAE